MAAFPSGTSSLDEAFTSIPRQSMPRQMRRSRVQCNRISLLLDFAAVGAETCRLFSGYRKQIFPCLPAGQRDRFQVGSGDV
jgi:hypothetical protein